MATVQKGGLVYRGEKSFFATAIGIVLVNLVIWGAIIGVAIHFIRKFW